MTKPTYAVTFRNADEQLTCMFDEKYHSAKEAKKAIEDDAAFFLDMHNRASKYDAYTGYKRRATAKWVKPETLDYYEAKGKDGSKCIWQYFKI